MIRTALFAAAASLAIGLAAPAQAGWANGVISDNGLKTMNGLEAENGLKTINGLESENGLKATNGVEPQGAVQPGQALIRGILLDDGTRLQFLPR
jgi:hypothetical protein